MAKGKVKISCLVISTQEEMKVLHPVLEDVIQLINADIHLNLYSPSHRNTTGFGRNSEKDFFGAIISSDLILFNLNDTSAYSFFEVGAASAMNKPIAFLYSRNNLLEDLPDFIKGSYSIGYKKREELISGLKELFVEYLENPSWFAQRNLLESKSSSNIDVDLEKLDQRDFENLCFELLLRLGYKKLEWTMKDEFVDAITTLRKQDPDEFEYEEFWLISFKDNMNYNMFDILLHEPEYFIHRISRNFLESNLLSTSSIKFEGTTVPITLLIIIRDKENISEKIKELSRRDLIMKRKSSPLTIRIRWWDKQKITSLVQNNLQLARKYFSVDALTKSGIRLSYEELYKQNLGMYDELQKTNEALVSERSRIELLERDAAWKLLSFTAAHRLGNPMDAIDSELSNLKMAITMNKLDVIKEIVKSMEIPVEKAKSIVSQFRNLSIAHEIKPEVITSEKLQEILTNAAKPALDKKLEVLFKFKNTPDISVDIQKLSECFEELIRNSLHFIKGDHPQIVITTSLARNNNLPDKIDRTKKYIKITFTDNGCGVPHEKKKEIFKPFERSYVHGTGLGLAFCEIIVEKHGGKIRETGKPDNGASFEIFLPIINNK